VNLLLALLLARFHAARQALAESRHRDDGYSVEAVVVISLMVIVAIAVVGVLAAKLRAKAEGIDLDGHP
jgi:hypothetical protein